MVGHSPSMNQLRQTVERAAKANSRIMIVGPSGGGKELAARTLHTMSSRAEGPFVVINAAAIVPERMEVELFGVEQSNGEYQRKAGALEEAHGGTLFIDEVADMPRETQSKILRVLVDQTFQRVGGMTKVNVDVRIVSSTTRNLEAEIAEGPLPRGPLSPPLGGADPRAAAVGSPRGHPGAGRAFHGPDFALDRLAEAQDRRRRDGGAAIAYLAGQRPAAAQQRRTADDPRRRRSGRDDHRRHAAAGRRLDGARHADRPQRRAHHGTCRLREAREVFERDYLIAQISRFSGNISRTAEFVGMERSALHRKLKALGVG